MEKHKTIMVVAGLGCFILAWILSGWLPLSHLGKIPMKTMDEIAPEASLEFIDLAKRYPEQFEKYYPGGPTKENFHKALRLAKEVYIGEACWHCHSQFVRPVSNEDQRFGKVSYAAEYMNEMNLPHLFGTRRVGPDLIRESGKHGNDWHVAHFYDPSLVTPQSVMPRYSWFFDGDKPNAKGIAMIAYMQWLGSWATPEALAYDAKKAAAAPAAAPAGGTGG
ncbi:cbb3-type cytochrome c oxidase subunit II [Myxococcota bacterium]|nr:cbb3-type cytochrome c oxidase subunit II [Myxococcota bacterium]